MDTKKIKRLVLTFIAVFIHFDVFARGTVQIDGYLALVELVSVEEIDPSEVGAEHIIKTGLVNNPIGKVLEVYTGPEYIVGSLFPMTPPPHLEGEAEDLTHTDVSFDGVFQGRKLPIGSKAVLNLHFRRDFDPRKQDFNPFGFPDRSIFFVLYGSGFGFDNTWTDLFNRRLDLAKAIKRFNGIEEDDDRVAFLKQSVQNEAPLLSVSAVHLLKRFYPETAEEYFDEIIFAPGTPFFARLAIDHEFCLSRGQIWVNGKQKQLESILEKEASEVTEGSRLLSFRKQMIENGSWFGGRGERN